ncbi:MULTISPECIES: recombination mediator RecR [unclassified Campylobacter]|uniref:recombination mediator RecR n=1 Tax=unclassified Campylobacter TaxID=2593542 RepID=UPI001237B410|nr:MULTISPECIES: recombination mediator RecR [unclassified Campylobacter]KAA6225462.1 recombination protein RecR [Campylobacter sp. LR196d]KAA6227400.1 recombination protein RecR [Campylobacter sp. LR185c]KAA6229733.1 recombination protein RecR [Campylobacter sp. LR286c]KAA6234258.1 recombination protein RecR [Campylobacter sp. LR291e]KAA6234476.1 recombination protein RecR [Campylobacter sp. LR264d]
MKNGLEKFNEVIKSFEGLPSIGKKTAVKLAYFVCIENKFQGLKLANNIENGLQFIRFCEQCGGLSENELCEFCSDENRDNNIICIVQNPKDILILEESKSYNGLYFVLNDLGNENIEKLISMIQNTKANELFFAITASINSDAIIFYVEDKLKFLNLKFSQIAQGIQSGVSLENVDFISLSKAITNRVKIED